MKDIKFSVVISCFNLGSTISNAISSIKKQTFANYECLIVDDCSSDNTLDFIRQAIGNDKRFSIIRHEKNESLYMTRKTGVKNSCGEYLIFLDGDDTLCENALEEIKTIEKQGFGNLPVCIAKTQYSFSDNSLGKYCHN